jgi:hypothetical protein
MFRSEQINCQDDPDFIETQSFVHVDSPMPIAVFARFKSRSFFGHSNAEVVGSNPTGGMDVCMSVFCVCVDLCVGRDLATG